MLAGWTCLVACFLLAAGVDYVLLRSKFTWVRVAVASVVGGILMAIGIAALLYFKRAH
jgi:hypothetical protein